MSSLKDTSYGNLIGTIVDEANGAIRATITNAEVDINVSAFTDSIAIADAAGTKVTVTNVAGKKSLDVNVTDLALSHSSDSVRIGDGTNLVGVSDVGGAKALKVDVLSMPASSGGLTDAQLRATPVPVEATIDTTGLSTDACDTSLASIDTKTPSLGQAAMAASTPVVIASNQSAVPVSGTFWQSTQPVSGSVSVSNFPASQAVTGTFWQGTQPVSGPLTDSQLRAAAVPVSGTVTANAGTGTFTVSGTVTANVGTGTQPVSGTVTANAGTGTFATSATQLPSSLVNGRLDVNIGASPNTLNVAMAPATVTFKGRASTFRTPGRAGTAGQKILSLHNATGSAVTVTVAKVIVDFACTVVKAVTVLPPVVRLWKVTVLPTNGTALTKTKIGGTGTSSSSVTVLGDASADGTLSASALTATLPAGAIVTQEFAPRLITAAGYEPADRMEFLGDTTVTLGALEGLVVFVDYVLATQNPATDMWIAGIEWTEV